MADSQSTRAPSVAEETTPVEYRPIHGHPNYEVGSDGTVRSLIGQKARILKPAISSGYLRVSLGQHNNALVHRLVLEAFVGPCPDGMECCHNNGIRSDARLSNLRWDTRKGNHADKRAHGTHQSGEKNGAAILTNDQVVAIKQRLVAGDTCKAIASDFGLHIATIGKIRSGEHWKDVAPELNAKFPEWKYPAVNGKSLRQEAISRGVNPTTVSSRLRKGYSLEEALSPTSVQGFRRTRAKELLSEPGT